jgi:hypothetical protein
MKVEDFLSGASDEQHEEDLRRLDEAVKNLQEVRLEHVTSLTPSGLEVLYSWAPKRLYRVRRRLHRSDWEQDEVRYTDWVEVPSVTTVLGVLDKSGALTWWGQGIGVEGALELARRGIIVYGDGHWTDSYNGVVDKDDVVKFLTQEKLTVNHVKDKAADRGTSVHNVFETWCKDTSFRPTPDVYPENEQGYVTGLLKFLNDLGDVDDVEAEIMVGSLVHGFAGRFDARLTIPSAREMVVKCYPKRKPKVQEVSAGRWLLDVKTSKSVYDTHALQLAAYELASVECGYGPTDYRAVIHLTADGQYELVQTKAGAADFLSVLQAYQTMSGSKGWL